MSSLAILPPLKRTLTELEVDDLYQVPNYPVSYLPVATAAVATESQPQIIQQNLFNHDNGSVNSVDDLTYPINHEMNPFNTYANPDLTLPIRPLTRRITTIEDEEESFLNSNSGAGNNQMKKKDDYLLYNPNIEPSLISNYPDDYDALFVPNNVVSSSSSIVPGFEHDYLYCQDYDDELIEEDLSDDDDDYKHDYLLDDDLLDNHYDDILQQSHNNNQFMVLDYLKDNEADLNGANLNGGYIDNFGIKNDTEFSSETSQSVATISPMLDSNTIPLTPESDDMQIDDEEFNPDGQEYEEKFQPQHNVTTKHHPHNASNDHFCSLINPTTGQACNKQFSRPYDLVRHQETIHASKKKIFRCVICEGRLHGGPGNGKSKTFSRGDALSRHIKVKHGLTGKDATDLINEAKENVEYVNQ